MQMNLLRKVSLLEFRATVCGLRARPSHATITEMPLNLKTAVGGEFFFLTQRRREAENAEKVANL